MSNKNKHTATGIIRITKKGVGYVESDTLVKDVLIKQEYLLTSLHGDTVEVVLNFSEPGVTLKGRITKIISRHKTTFVGKLDKDEGLTFFIPQNRKIHVDFLIPENQQMNAQPDDLVKVELIKWDDPMKAPLAKVVAIIGKSGDNNAEMEAILYENDIDPTLPQRIEDEAKQIKNQEQEIMAKALEERADMREVITLTIDPDTAKDFDDAISMQTLPNGDIEIGIHIADVTHYVKPGSAIDEEALRRGTSVYLVDRTIPMLPEVLSNDLCSLNPDVDRLAFSAIVIVSAESIEPDKPFLIKEKRVEQVVIRSSKRFTYENAQKVLDDGQGEFFKELFALNTLAKKFEKANKAGGALTFGHNEVKFILDDEGVPVDAYQKEVIDTNKLVEQFMLLANKTVTEYVHETIEKEDRLFLYRVHEKPEEEKIKELASFLKTLGFTLPVHDGAFSSQDLNKIIEEAHGTDEEHMVSQASVRAMQRAVYSTHNKGHFGLATKLYTHFTSPIRRYPDVVVHRLLKTYLAGDKIEKDNWLWYEKTASSNTASELIATRAERSSIKYKQVEYMKSRIGNEYEGIITGVTNWGMYVEDTHSGSEGLISVKDLKNDYYTFEKDKQRLIGTKTKKIFKLGDHVKIKVKKVSVNDQTIDYSLVD